MFNNKNFCYTKCLTTNFFFTELQVTLATNWRNFLEERDVREYSQTDLGGLQEVSPTQQHRSALTSLQAAIQKRPSAGSIQSRDSCFRLGFLSLPTSARDTPASLAPPALSRDHAFTEPRYRRVSSHLCGRGQHPGDPAPDPPAHTQHAPW